MQRVSGVKRMSGRDLVSVLCLMVLAIMLLSPVSASAQVLPGFRAPMIEGPNSVSVYIDYRLGQGTSTQGPSTTDPEIAELARGLKYDPGLMYKFVHDHIRFTPTWGETKGAYMTWMDRSGNGFDQATLLIALLTQAAQNGGNGYTITNIQYGVGDIQPTVEQFTSWFAIDNNARIAKEVLARGGFYADVAGTDNNPITSVKFVHAWVKVTINGTTYRLDPSFKSHHIEDGILNLSSSGMEYDRDTFIANAQRVGGGYDTDNIREDLDTYTENLASYIAKCRKHTDSSFPDVNDALEDIIGDKRIVPVEEVMTTSLPQTLPYGTVLTPPERESFGIGAIPSIYRTTLRIRHCGIDQTLYSSNIYGRRLSIKYDGSNQPQLTLNGQPLATGTACTLGQEYDLTLTVDHPYEATSFDATTTLKIKAGGFYQIVNGWGDTGTKIILKHRGLLRDYKLASYADTSEEVLGESYAIVGLTWLAKTSVMRSMAAEADDHTVVNHHILGVTGQYEAPYIDLGLCHFGITDQGLTDRPQALFHSMAAHSAAYEHEVISQLQDSNAVSTPKLFEMANNLPSNNEILTATRYNWNTIRSQLVNYNDAEKQDVNEYVAAGFEVAMPRYGDLTLDDWTGTGFRAMQRSGRIYTIAFIAGDGYGGGISCTDAALSSSTVMDTCVGAASDGDPEGAYGTGSTDITIGNGGFPFGLAFGRQYSSHRRTKDGPLGLGWTHNFDISVKVLSDSWQILGADSATDAAAHIVSLKVARSIEEPNDNYTLAGLCANWLMDKMKDNVVDLKQGSSTTRFTKVVKANETEDSYQGPTGQTIRLLKRSNGYFRLKNASGVFYDFDASGKLDNVSDAHGNIMDLVYDSGKLNQVLAKIKPASGDAVTARSLSFTYTGDRIASVTDSASRTVSYSYTNGQLTTFTNPDGNDVTYEYVENKPGLLEKIIPPVDPGEPNDPILTVGYDSLCRMIQQIDANNCTWDYYRATYRTEVLPPAQRDPNNEVKRYGTATWANPEARTVTSKDALGRVTTSQYDPEGRTDSVTGPAGTSAAFTYNENNNVVSTMGLSIPGSGDPSVLKEYDYSYCGDPNNPEQRWFINMKQQTDSAGNKGYYYYDYNDVATYGTQLGRLMKIASMPSDPETDANRPVVQFTYYSDGQIHEKIEKKDASNSIVTHFEYYPAASGAGLKKTIADANGLNITTEVGYDNVGRTVWTKDPRGNIAESEYSAAGLLKKTIAPDPFGYETTYEYDAQGRLQKVKQVVAGAAASVNDFDDDPNCVAVWNLESGGLTADSVGNNTLTNSGVVADTATFKQGAGSADFEASESDYMSIANASQDSGFPFKSGENNRNISVSAWIRLETEPAYYGYYVICSRNDASTNQHCFLLSVNNGPPLWFSHLVLTVGAYGGYSSEAFEMTNCALQAGRWYHIGVTFRDSDRSYRFRVWDETTGTVTEMTGNGYSGYSTDPLNVPWRLGRSITWNGGFATYDGLIDEMAVFNDILTANEIDQIRQGSYDLSPDTPTSNDFSGDSACVSLWRMENGQLTTDSKGSNTLTNVGVASSTSSYKEGAGSAAFHEASSYPDRDSLSIADSSLSSDFPGKSNTSNKTFSVSLWAKFDYVPSTNHRWPLVTKANGSRTTYSLSCDAGGYIVLRIGDGIGQQTQSLTHGSALTGGRWYHIGAAFDDSSHTGKIRIWDDTAGAIVGTDAQKTDFMSMGNSSDAFMIGGLDTIWYVNLPGLLDEVVLFNDILTTTEIDQIRQHSYVRSAAGPQTIILQEITYNNRSQKETVRGPYREGASQSERDINYTQYAYDSLGRAYKVTDAEGNITTTRYYPDGKVWKVIDAEGHTTVTNTYNTQNGSLQQVEDAKGNVTRYEYNGFMALKKTIFEDDTFEQMDYDTYRRLLRKHTRSDQTLEFAYDGFGRVKTKTVKEADNTVVNTIRYRYDLLGRLTTTLDNTGTIANAYDNAGRVTQITYPGSRTVAYQYDLASNRTRLTYPDSTYVTYEYDALSRLTAVKNSSGTALATYTYDERSRRTALDYANGAGMDYSYDTASRLLSLDNSTNSGHYLYEYTYDKVGNRTTMAVTDNSGTEMHAYSYDNIYQVTGVDYPAGYDPDLATDTTFNYDDAGNRTSVIDAGGTSSYVTNALNQYTAVGGVSYTYDNSGNMTYDGANMYSYDPENRLTTVQKTPDPLAAACDIALAFTCGGDANWFSQSSEYNYDADAVQSGDIGDGQSTWIETTVTGSGTLYFDYKVSSQTGDDFIFYIDGQYQFARGGVTSWIESPPYTLGTGTHTLRWKYIKDGSGSGGSDCAWVDHVRWSGTMPSLGSWSTIAYTYDPSGRRIEKKVDGAIQVKYVYDGDHIIAEYNNAGTLLRKYVHGPCIDEPVCMIEASGTYAGTYYYHYDALGSVIAITNSSGNVVQLYEYSIYGQVAVSEENHPNRFMFTGREIDEDTGLYYYRARYYNPEIGRFLQTDPIGYDDGMNWYAYCGNGPIRSADPSGMVSYGLRRGPTNAWNNSWSLFLEFYRINDDGTTETLPQWQFFSAREFIDLAERSIGETNPCENPLAGVFSKEWMEGEAGWKLAGQGEGKSREWWFWRLKVLAWLDQATGIRIGCLEGDEDLGTAHLRIGGNTYDGGTNTLSWDPTDMDIYDYTCGDSRDRAWHSIDPLVALGHELSHLYDDVVQNSYDGVSVEEREVMAVKAENSLRFSMYSKDPSCYMLYPRPGYQDWWPDLGTNPDKAWTRWTLIAGEVGWGSRPR